jgi:hypothetical protein
MVQKWIAVSVMTAFCLLAIFAITIAAAYAVNERCTEQMAWDGNC